MGMFPFSKKASISSNRTRAFRLRASFRSRANHGIEEEDVDRPVMAAPEGVDIYDEWAAHVKAHLNWPLVQEILQGRWSDMTGVWLALQFFTAVPIQKEYPLGRKEVTAMYVGASFCRGSNRTCNVRCFRFDARRSWDGPAA